MTGVRHVGGSSKAVTAAKQKSASKPKSKPGTQGSRNTVLDGGKSTRLTRPGKATVGASIARTEPAPKPVPTKAAPIAADDVKLVRDSFTMPGEDFDLIAQLKARALEFKRPTKKSELLRAGLQQLATLSEPQLRAALAALRPLPTGRPKKKR